MSDLPKNITGSISLRFKAWLYADGSKISSYNASLARYLQDQLPSDSLWTVTEVLDTGLAKPGPKQSFIPIQVTTHLFLAILSLATLAAPNGGLPVGVALVPTSTNLAMPTQRLCK